MRKEERKDQIERAQKEREKEGVQRLGRALEAKRRENEREKEKENKWKRDQPHLQGGGVNTKF